MNKIMKLAFALFCAFVLVNSAYAQNVTEFGIEGDLTVLGTLAGSASDPDVEIKGFTVFGATEAAPGITIPIEPGNIFVNGYIEVSSGMYVTGSSTFTSGAYFTGISSFVAGPSNIFISGGTDGQVLKKKLDGSMEWLDEAAGVSGGGTLDYLPLWKPDGATLGDSRVWQDEVDGSTHVYVSGDIHLSSSVYFGNNIANISTFTENGGLRFYDGYDMSAGDDYDAATKIYVDGQVGSAGPWKRTGSEVTLDNIGDEVGIGIDAPLAALHVSSNNPVAGDYLFTVSSGPLVGNNIFTVKGDMSANMLGSLTIAELLTAQKNLTVNDNAQLGATVADYHGINTAPVSGTALKIVGADAGNALEVVGDASTPGNYVAKFYSGDPAVPANLAAWIKKKIKTSADRGEGIEDREFKEVFLYKF